MSAAVEPRLGGGVAVSVVLHAGLIAALFVLRPGAPRPSAPIYHVQLYAAPTGERAAGVVRDQPTPTPPTPAPVPASTKTPSLKKPPVNQKTKAARTPVVATPQSPTKPPDPVKPAQAPTAGGGATGGSGADVANVRTDGVDFPYQAYIDNIASKIIQRFHTKARLTAEVQFIIRRDGTVDLDGIHLSLASRVYDFDQAAMAAVEGAAAANSFGPLPPGFREDILPVTFRFTPSLIR